jgi:hypothetical protein
MNYSCFNFLRKSLNGRGLVMESRWTGVFVGCLFLRGN